MTRSLVRPVSFTVRGTRGGPVRAPVARGIKGASKAQAKPASQAQAKPVTPSKPATQAKPAGPSAAELAKRRAIAAEVAAERRAIAAEVVAERQRLEMALGPNMAKFTLAMKLSRSNVVR